MSALNSRRRGIRQQAVRLRRELLRLLSRHGRRVGASSTAAVQAGSDAGAPLARPAGRGAVR